MKVKEIILVAVQQDQLYLMIFVMPVMFYIVKLATLQILVLNAIKLLMLLDLLANVLLDILFIILLVFSAILQTAQHVNKLITVPLVLLNILILMEYVLLVILKDVKYAQHLTSAKLV